MPTETHVVGILFRRATIYCTYIALDNDTQRNNSSKTLRFFFGKAKSATEGFAL